MSKLFFVLVHGLNTSKNEFSTLEKLIKIRFDSPKILNSNINSEEKSREGIKICSKRLFKEIKNFMSENIFEKHSLVMIGHSFGGILCRYCLDILFDDEIGQLLDPHSFITFSTPHLGIQRSSGSLMNNILKYGINIVGLYCLGESVKELTLQDADQILIGMCEDKYLKLLDKFKHKTLIGVSVGDYFSPLCTSCIVESNPFSSKSNETCRFEVLDCKGFDNDKFTNLFEFFNDFNFVESITIDSEREVDFQSTMFKKLDSLNWRRIYLDINLPFSLNNLFQIDKWMIQVHNAPIGNIFLHEDFGSENVKHIRKKSIDFMEFFIKILMKDAL
eukprot:gene7117-11280_t